MRKILIADKLPQASIDMLKEAGFEVLNQPGLDATELTQKLCQVDGVICRSGAKLTEEVLQETETLKAICRAGVGVDNIDIPAATRKGIVVMNTPGANTISTAEHTIALILALARNIGPAYISMREGKWDRKKFTGMELAQNTLGIVGLGRVGQAVAKRALAFEMDIIAYDPFISEQIASKLGIKLIDSLKVLLKECDYLTIHVPSNDKTKGLLAKEKIALMKPTARIVNCARGEIIDQKAVVEAVKNGELAGAAFDVYEQEPPENFEFAQDNRILTTPHLGASTEAAQIAVGTQAASQMIDALEHEHYRNALNITSVPQEEMEYLNPFCNLARKLGIITAALSEGRPRSLQLTCMGEIAERDISPVLNHGVTGVLQYMLGNSVNVVSAPHLAEERGLAITSSTKRTAEASFTNMIVLKLETKSKTIEVAGTVLENTHPRVIKIGPYETELLPDGNILLSFGHDKPGTIGKVGDVLGADNVNIARMTFGRQKIGGEALLALNIDTPCEEETLEKIKKLDVVDNAIMISL